MSIFKKLFGTSTESGKNINLKKPDIDLLIGSSDKNKSIIELDNYICELCS
jgi:hypothetical protein